MRGRQEIRIGRARDLRRNATDAEAKLWLLLRDRRLAGAKFVRQCPAGPYYADFACRARKIIVELDGGQHAESGYDARRDAWLRGQGYRVIRVWNNDVLANPEGVLEMLLTALDRAAPPG